MRTITLTALCTHIGPATIRTLSPGRFQFVSRCWETSPINPEYFREWTALGITCEFKAEPDP